MKTAILLLLSLFALESKAQLLFTQYVETNSGTSPKGVEVWNSSYDTLDFSQTPLEIHKGINGAALSNDFTLNSGKLAPREVIVIGSADLQTVTQSNGSAFYLKPFTFNGDDALGLVLNGTLIDVIGKEGEDPGTHWTGNGVDTRNSNIELRLGLADPNPLGWSDPSARFETNSVSLFDGFGIPPMLIFNGSWRNNQEPSSNTSLNDCKITSGTAQVSSNISLANLNLAKGTRLEVNKDYSLTLVKSLSGSGRLVLKSGGSFLPEAAASLDTIIIEVSGQDANRNNYNFWCSPIVNPSLPSIFSGSNLSDMYQFDPSLITSAGNTAAGWKAAGSPQVGEGFTATPNTSQPGAAPIQFEGVANNGNISLTMKANSVPSSGLTENSNLIGNPYPSGISAKAFLDGNSNLVKAIYLWDASSSGGQYIVTDGTPDVNISAGQGFFVDWVSGSGNNQVTFTPAMRTTEQDALYRSAPEPRIHLKVAGTKLIEDQCQLKFGANYSATSSRQYDAIKMLGSSELSFYSSSPGSVVPLAIQARESILEPLKISLSVLYEGQQMLRLAIDTLIDFPSNTEIILIDHLLQTKQKLKASSAYQFFAGIGSEPGRFTLLVSPGLSATPAHQAMLRTQAEGLYFSQGKVEGLSSHFEFESMAVYNALGQLVLSTDINSGIDLKSGIYLIHLTGANTEQKALIQIP